MSPGLQYEKCHFKACIVWVGLMNIKYQTLDSTNQHVQNLTALHRTVQTCYPGYPCPPEPHLTALTRTVQTCYPGYPWPLSIYQPRPSVGARNSLPQSWGTGREDEGPASLQPWWWLHSSTNSPLKFWHPVYICPEN